MQRPFDVTTCKVGETMEQVPERQTDERSQQLQDEVGEIKKINAELSRNIDS